jgi:hypothetical protein
VKFRRRILERAMRPRRSIVRGPWLALLLCAACREPEPEKAPAPAPKAVVADASIDGSAAKPFVDEGPPKRLFAKRFVVKVRTAANKDSFRWGYLRGGAVVQAKTGLPISFDRCRKGWYELEGGGFVCSTVDVIPFLGKRLPERRTLQPDLSAVLPYPYGYSRRKNTPMYRRLPTDEEAHVYEGFPLPPSADGGVAELGQLATAPAAAPAPVPENAAAAAQPPSMIAALAGVDRIDEAGAPGSGEGEESVATLASLMGEEGGVLMRRMERGFYVSLDREMQRGTRKYFRTQSNGFIPNKAINPAKPSEFKGVVLSAELQLPIAFVMSKSHFAYLPNKAGKLRPDKQPGYHHMFRVTGETQQGRATYLIADDGRHYRSDEVAKIVRRDKPPEVTDSEKWLDIDLAAQTLVAYVGSQPVFATLVSTGRIKDELDPLKNFETPAGEFRITSKHLSATMDGDHAIDGPYSIEDVPYVMYFQLAFALHSAFWHNGFGRPRSHGCINLAPLDARWVFNFVEPQLPVPWHGVFPKPEEQSTRLYIHGKTPEG